MNVQADFKFEVSGAGTIFIDSDYGSCEVTRAMYEEDKSVMFGFEPDWDLIETGAGQGGTIYVNTKIEDTKIGNCIVGIDGPHWAINPK